MSATHQQRSHGEHRRLQLLAHAGFSRTEALQRPPPRMVSSPVLRYIAVRSSCHVPTPSRTASLYRTMEACVECATRPTHPPRAREASTAGTPAVAASHPRHHACAEQPSSSIGRAWQHSSRPRTTMHGLRLRETMEAHASMECATRSTRLPRAREASTAGTPAVAAPHPPPRVLSSPVARPATAGQNGTGSACHVPHQ